MNPWIVPESEEETRTKLLRFARHRKISLSKASARTGHDLIAPQSTKSTVAQLDQLAFQRASRCRVSTEWVMRALQAGSMTPAQHAALIWMLAAVRGHLRCDEAAALFLSAPLRELNLTTASSSAVVRKLGLLDHVVHEALVRFADERPQFGRLQDANPEAAFAALSKALCDHTGATVTDWVPDAAAWRDYFLPPTLNTWNATLPSETLPEGASLSRVVRGAPPGVDPNKSRSRPSKDAHPELTKLIRQLSAGGVPRPAAISMLASLEGTPTQAATRDWLTALLASQENCAATAARKLNAVKPFLAFDLAAPLARELPNGQVTLDREAWLDLADAREAGGPYGHNAAGKVDETTLAMRKEFVAQLAARSGAPVDWMWDALLLDGQASRVRACLVTVSDVERAFALLGDDVEAVLAGALGFYTGLRIGEVRNIRLADFVDRTALKLRVRAHPTSRLGPGNTLKSAAARRLLGMGDLLPQPHFGLLDEHIYLRRLETPAGSHGLLFTVDLDDPVSFSAPTRFIWALRSVTSDPTLSFHSLRHSFASWSFLRLHLHLLPRVRDCGLVGIDHAHFSEQAVNDWVAAVFEPHGGPMTHLSTLARLMGHEFVATTLEHYVHIRSWVERAYLDERLPSAADLAGPCE